MQQDDGRQHSVHDTANRNVSGRRHQGNEFHSRNNLNAGHWKTPGGQASHAYQRQPRACELGCNSRSTTTPGATPQTAERWDHALQAETSQPQPRGLRLRQPGTHTKHHNAGRRQKTPQRASITCSKKRSPRHARWGSHIPLSSCSTSPSQATLGFRGYHRAICEVLPRHIGPILVLNQQPLRPLIDAGNRQGSRH